MRSHLQGDAPLAQAALARASPTASTRRPGCHRPATAPNKERVALTTMAAANPALNAWGEVTLPVAENTETAIAIPSTPPKKRSVHRALRGDAPSMDQHPQL